jgi:hypothetical protein
MEGRQLIMVLSPKKGGKGSQQAKAGAAPKKAAPATPKAKVAVKKTEAAEPQAETEVAAGIEKK